VLTLLATIWQADTAFPSGSFAFSNGLEGAAALGETLDRASLTAILEAILRHRWATSDRLAVVRAFRAAGDLPTLAALDRSFDVAILNEPLRLGSRRNGAALLAAHRRLGTPSADGFQCEIAADRAFGHLPVAQGLLWQASGLDESSAVAASGYVTAAGIVAAAVRLGRIGAIDAQSVLARALPIIAEWAGGEAIAVSAGEPSFASMTPWIDIAASRHARADIRLFSN
jgi:urease accessory protein